MTWAETDSLLFAGSQPSTTYAALLSSVRPLVAALRARGTGRGDRVAVVLPRSTDLVRCLLAVLETGAAWVPIEPEQPAERIAWFIEDAQPTLIEITPPTAAR